MFMYTLALHGNLAVSNLGIIAANDMHIINATQL